MHAIHVCIVDASCRATIFRPKVQPFSVASFRTYAEVLLSQHLSAHTGLTAVSQVSGVYMLSSAAGCYNLHYRSLTMKYITLELVRYPVLSVGTFDDNIDVTFVYRTSTKSSRINNHFRPA